MLYFCKFTPHFGHSMTRRFLSFSTLVLTGLLATQCSLCADTTNTMPDFKEVYELLRTNLTGTTAENLNRAAVEGLLSQFPGKVSLVGGTADDHTAVLEWCSHFAPEIVFASRLLVPPAQQGIAFAA